VGFYRRAVASQPNQDVYYLRLSEAYAELAAAAPTEDQRNFFYEETGRVRSTTRIVVADGAVVGFNLLGRRWDHSVLLRWIEERRSLDHVLHHLDEARFDTEFVPPLVIPGDARGELDGPAPSRVEGPTPVPVAGG
ncbi:MAG: hypothetical protein R3266_14585, partial [Gemmatimonadota bacterium]|nr:hypothetical protein [Gemmatimonadota bacterium]